MDNYVYKKMIWARRDGSSSINLCLAPSSFYGDTHTDILFQALIEVNRKTVTRAGTGGKQVLMVFYLVMSVVLQKNRSCSNIMPVEAQTSNE